MSTLQLLIFLVYPYNIEAIIDYYSNQGNLGLVNVYLMLYKKRNILYISLFSLIPLYFFSHLMCGILVFTISLYSFFYECNQWENILIENST